MEIFGHSVTTYSALAGTHVPLLDIIWSWVWSQTKTGPGLGPELRRGQYLCTRHTVNGEQIFLSQRFKKVMIGARVLGWFQDGYD